MFELLVVEKLANYGCYCTRWNGLRPVHQKTLPQILCLRQYKQLATKFNRGHQDEVELD